MSEEISLKAAYLEFLKDEHKDISSGENHIHPSPSWMKLYSNILAQWNGLEYNSESNIVEVPLEKLITLMDILVRFTSEVTCRWQPYQEFKKCRCVQIDDDELAEAIELWK